MNLPKIVSEDNCYYLIQDISDMDLYDRCKAIVNFCDKETKIFEKEIDRAILEIFAQNGINVPNTNKSVLKSAFERLNAKGTHIEVVDLYKKNGRVIDEEQYYIVCQTKNHFTVMLETNYISGNKVEVIQCGVMVKEIKKNARRY